MNKLFIDQRSPEWYQAKLGVLSASRIKKAMASQRQDLINELAAEILTQNWDEIYVTEDMQRGIDLEPNAREAYSELTGNQVDEIGMILSDYSELIGYSPDGLVSDTISLEIKCPDTKNHIDTIRHGKVPTKYHEQTMYAFVVCDDIQEVHYFSFDPRLEQRPCFLVVLKREDYLEEIEKIKKVALTVVKQVDEVVKMIQF